MYRHDSAPSRITDGRFGHVAHGDRSRRIAVSTAAGLVEQKLDQGHVDFPDPGDREHVSGRSRRRRSGAEDRRRGRRAARHRRRSQDPWASWRIGDRSGRPLAIAPLLAVPSPRSEPSPRTGWDVAHRQAFRLMACAIAR